jgi:hypothetical protein
MLIASSSPAKAFAAPEASGLSVIERFPEPAFARSPLCGAWSQDPLRERSTGDDLMAKRLFRLARDRRREALTEQTSESAGIVLRQPLEIADLPTTISVLDRHQDRIP